jgi:small subunit ribosomal protein S9
MSNEDLTSATESDAPPAVEPASVSPTSERVHGLGRRKTAVARVHLRPGSGKWSINGRTLQDYFPRGILQQGVLRPLAVTETEGQFDVLVRVAGGGQHGQADAIRLGLARALLKIDEGFRTRLRAETLLTRDAREVERKKPGRPKARKRFQFSKR